LLARQNNMIVLYTQAGEAAPRCAQIIYGTLTLL